MPDISNCYDSINYLNEKISKFYSTCSLFKTATDQLEKVSASVIIFSKYKDEIWLLGDCQCMLDNKTYVNKLKIDFILSEARSCFIYSEIAKGKTITDIQRHDTGRTFIKELLVRQKLFQNSNLSEYSYGILNGCPIKYEKIKIFNTQNVKTIILASDGYPKIFNSLIKSEDYLQDILKKDPLCYKFSNQQRVCKQVMYPLMIEHI